MSVDKAVNYCTFQVLIIPWQKFSSAVRQGDKVLITLPGNVQNSMATLVRKT